MKALLGRSDRQIEVASQVTVDAMDVVGWVAGRVGLGVDELDQESLSLDAIVVANSRLLGTGPSEADVVPAVGLDLFSSAVGNRIGCDVGIE